jgi:hypothetical protein
VPRGRGSEVELLGHWGGGHCWRDLEIVAATAQIDHVAIVRVAENAREIVLAQARAVTPEDLASLCPHGRGARGALIGRERADRFAHETERFVPRQTLSTRTNAIFDRRLSDRR